MEQAPLDTRSPELGSAIERNLLEFWAAYGETPRGDFSEEGGVARFMSAIPHALFNGVFLTRLAADTVDAAIETTIEYFRSHGAPAFWWSLPSTQPRDLATRLERHGLVDAGTGPVMIADLSLLQEAQSPPAGLTVETAADPSALEAWANVAWVGTGLPCRGREEFVAQELGVGVNPETPRRRYTGYLRGSPVATSMLILRAGVAGIFAVATLPEVRRQGIGAAMTLAAMVDAREMGYRTGALLASQMGEPVYRRLGFETIFEVGNHLFDPERHSERHDGRPER